MKITNKMINDYIKNSDNFVDKIIMLRLYNEYKNNDITEVYDNKSLLLKFNMSQDKILEKTKEIFDDNKKIGLNIYKDDIYKEDIEKKILDNNIMLDDCFYNCDLTNKDSVQNMKDIITLNECLLNLPITFPSNLEHCIEKEISSKGKSDTKIK